MNDIGAMCPTFDKPEQGLDLLQEAITNCGLTAGEDFFIGLNCAGPEIFDYVSKTKNLRAGPVSWKKRSFTS